MAQMPAEQAFAPQAGSRLIAFTEGQGSGAHPYQSSDALLRGPESSRNLADAAHFLCTVHGRYPGIVDHAVRRLDDPSARAWFHAACSGFSEERAFLARLSVEVGPIPGTPGSTGAESALLAQRHALDMLAQSERNGCAVGAALALIADWSGIRLVLNIAAGRYGIEPAPCRLPNRAEVQAMADSLAVTPLVERAMLFGAEQTMLQHHGLWDLLDARQMARAGI